MHDGALFSWKWLYICLMKGGSEQIPYFILIALTIFALPIKLSLSQPTSFITFTFLILSPSHMGRVSKQLCGAKLPARVKL